jgi:sterol desaturase/sphingolipid hydroxylase (fatty acid hydroxylase superfamily)
MLSWIDDTVTKAVVGAMIPLRDFLLNGDSRYYWLYCLSGVLIAAFAYRRHGRIREFEAQLADKRTWLSRSAINDYIIVVVAPALRLTLLSWTVINWKPVSAAVVSALKSVGVAGSVNDTTAIGLGVVLTVALFIADDFFRWYIHYLFHKVPELWEFHKVHHTAEVLNFVTADRQHPVEVIATGAALSIVYGVVNGLFIATFGDKLTVTTIAGANVFLFVFNICGGALRHSPFYLSFGPTIERWVISPAMHQVHHSNKQEHYDRNMGGSLAVWDRMFGTLHIPTYGEIEGYGIGEETADFRSLEVIYMRHFTASYALLKKRLGRGKPETAKPVSQPAMSA